MACRLCRGLRPNYRKDGALTHKRLSADERLRLFDAATARQREREKTMQLPPEPPIERGWTRDELYQRGKPR